MFARSPKKSAGQRERGGQSSAATDTVLPFSLRRPGSDLVREALQSSGQPLDRAARLDFEGRFHTDLSRVRVHTGAAAATSARSVAAEAYTVGNHIVFSRDAYRPTARGRESLLAHELVHVLRQEPGLHRKPDPAVIKEFNQRAAAVRQLPLFKEQSKKDRWVAILTESILAEARNRSNALYYIGKLELLFNTPMSPPQSRAAQATQKGAQLAHAEQTRLADPKAASEANREETLTANAGKHDWVQRVGEGGKIFWVSRSSPSHLLVRLKVRLTPVKGATLQDVSNIRSLEDGIEKAAATRGYSVDLQFSNTSGPDVFEVRVNPEGWTDSGNWSPLAANGPVTLAHEMHHLLGLPDRYNYIEAHAANSSMEFVDRLWWFREQMRRVYDPTLDKQSIMGSGSDVTEADVDEVAGLSPAQIQARQRSFKKEDTDALLWQSNVRDQRSSVRGSP